MRALKAFVLGSLALGIVGYALAAALAVAAQAGGSHDRCRRRPAASSSPSTLEGATTATTFGPGSSLLALAGGAREPRCGAAHSAPCRPCGRIA